MCLLKQTCLPRLARPNKLHPRPPFRLLPTPKPHADTHKQCTTGDDSRNQGHPHHVRAAASAASAASAVDDHEDDDAELRVRLLATVRAALRTLSQAALAARLRAARGGEPDGRVRAAR